MPCNNATTARISSFTVVTLYNFCEVNRPTTTLSNVQAWTCHQVSGKEHGSIWNKKYEKAKNDSLMEFNRREMKIILHFTNRRREHYSVIVQANLRIYCSLLRMIIDSRSFSSHTRPVPSDQQLHCNLCDEF